MRRTLAILTLCLASAAPARAALLHVHWMRGHRAAATPVRYDKVGVLEIGPRAARNVLVFEPGTSAGSAYIVPLAQWLVRTLPGWQVWSIERRQNLLEDQSVLTRGKLGRASPEAGFDYYLGWLTNSKIKRHIELIPDAAVGFAKNWGLGVAMHDLHAVVRAARRRGGKVVLSGHSLGGALVTAYATWDFGGRPGARDLAGLVFDDGASFGAPVSAATASSDLSRLRAPSTTPWVAFSSIPSPFEGLYATTGALGSIRDPNQPALGQTFSLLPAALNPGVPATNLALFAWNTNAATSKLSFASLAHLGRGVSARTVNGVHGWDARGALTPPRRWATMVAGAGVAGADGNEWYFPARLTLDIRDALGNGLANPAQKVLGVHATMGARLPHGLLMYAFGAAGGQAILDATRRLARQSHIPARNLTLVDRHGTYAHNDPAGAYPHNAFFTGLVRFLRKVDGRR